SSWTSCAASASTWTAAAWSSCARARSPLKKWLVRSWTAAAFATTASECRGLDLDLPGLPVAEVVAGQGVPRASGRQDPGRLPRARAQRKRRRRHLVGCLGRRVAPLRRRGCPFHRGVRRPLPDDAVALQLEPGPRGGALERGARRSREASGQDCRLRGGAAEVPRRRSADDREPPPGAGRVLLRSGQDREGRGPLSVVVGCRSTLGLWLDWLGRLPRS